MVRFNTAFKLKNIELKELSSFNYLLHLSFSTVKDVASCVRRNVIYIAILDTLGSNLVEASSIARFLK